MCIDAKALASLGQGPIYNQGFVKPLLCFQKKETLSFFCLFFFLYAEDKSSAIIYAQQQVVVLGISIGYSNLCIHKQSLCILLWS